MCAWHNVRVSFKLSRVCPSVGRIGRQSPSFGCPLTRTDIGVSNFFKFYFILFFNWKKKIICRLDDSLITLIFFLFCFLREKFVELSANSSVAALCWLFLEHFRSVGLGGVHVGLGWWDLVRGTWWDLRLKCRWDLVGL